MNQRIVEAWVAIKQAISEVDVDVMKNAKGNASAGVRARKVLRGLRNQLSELVKTTIEEEKEEKDSDA